VARLRAAIPGITFSTDIIVGFPGESEAQFEETLSLVAEAGFDEAYTFRYSGRDGTPAVRLKDHVPEEVAASRLERLIEVVRDQARTRHLSRVGSVHEVLWNARPGAGNSRSADADQPHGAARTTGIGGGRIHRVGSTGTTGSTFTGALQRAELAVL
jgi:tRNA-2-methylthio-N6-dimethylallyladenosine synthase